MTKAKFISFDKKVKEAICDRCRKVKMVKRFYFLSNNKKVSKYFCSVCIKNALNLNEQLSLFIQEHKYKNNLLNRLKALFKHLINRKVKK